MASFLNRLMSNISSGMNYDEPLFGGLIPRRIEREEPIVRSIDTEPPPMPQSVGGPIRQSGLDRVNNNVLGRGGNRQMNTRIDWTPQRLDVESQRLRQDTEQHTKDYNLREREQVRKESEDKSRLELDRNKFEIDSRKQALDEWKTQNPEGEIKVDENGRMVIIDRRSGTSIDTGLMGEHLSEEKKLELQAKNAQELEEIRQRNRIALEGAKAPRTINPSQQRTAEDDAAAELLRDPRYSWLEKEEIITRDQSGALKINRPTKGFYGKPLSDALGTIDAFERDWKAKSRERMNRTFSGQGISNIDLYEDTVDMTTPDGRTIQVPKSEIEEAKSKGAKLPGEEEKKPDSVKSAIEIIRDSGGRVVYAGNVKGKR